MMYSPEQTNVPVATPIQIASNEALDMNTFSIAGTPSIGAKPLVFYAGLSNLASYKYVYEIIPAGVLQLNTDYAITVSGARDMAGNTLTTLTFNFKTEAAPSAPAVVATSPANDGAGVALNPVISATFLARMDPWTLTAETFIVSNGTGTVAGTVSCNGTTATFIPATRLTSNTNYTVTITTGARDMNGNPLAADYQWSFTTMVIDTTPPVTTAGPKGGSYNSAQSVTLSSNETATIWYTTDGTTPTTSSAVYAGPISITGTTTLKFFGKDAAGNVEAVKTESYTITIPTVQVPAAPAGVSAACGNGGGCTVLTVTWGPSAGATAYNLYWKTSTGVTKLNGAQTPNITSPYLFPGNEGSTYFIVVTAVNAAGESAESPQTSATISNTPPPPPI
jgi:hypothetical protein